MANNKIKQIWQGGGAAVNGWLAIPDGFAAETMAQAGWDSVTVDLQHGVQDYMSMVRCFQAMQIHPVVPMVRVPWNEPGIIGKVLDAGAYGVICPMVNTVAEAKALVSSCNYPPLGARSNGPIRAGIYGVSTGYQKTANEEIICLPMMETAEAVSNMEAILDVPGITGVYIGPSDLGFSMGLIPILDREEPEILAIYEKIIRETGKRGLVAGVHCGSAAYAKRAIGMGFKLVTINNDSGILLTAAKAAVAEARGR
jgi:4-hydroxy-2-oxoheptanedioate aldolase